MQGLEQTVPAGLQAAVHTAGSQAPAAVGQGAGHTAAVVAVVGPAPASAVVGHGREVAAAGPVLHAWAAAAAPCCGVGVGRGDGDGPGEAGLGQGVVGHGHVPEGERLVHMDAVVAACGGAHAGAQEARVPACERAGGRAWVVGGRT